MDDVRTKTPGGRLAWFETARWVVPALFLLTIALRIAFLLIVPQVPISDGEWYVLRAAEMARGMGYQEAGHPTAFWPVGFPALLAGSMALFGQGLLGPMLVNLVSAAAIFALMLWFARTLGVGELAARIAVLIYAVYPSPIVYVGQPCSETAATAVGMAAFALLIAARRRWWMLVASGIVFGAATLMRAQMLLFPIGAIVAMLLAIRSFGRRDALGAAILVHLALAAVVLPWSLRNRAEMGRFILVSTNGGVALFTGANDKATGDWFPWEHTALWDQTGIPFSDRVVRQVDLDIRFRALATDWIKAHPLRWTALGFKKMALLWRKDSDAFWGLEASYPAGGALITALAAADQLFYMAVLALGIVALWIFCRAVWRRDARRAPLALLVCMPVFTTATAFGFTGQIRYHYPAMPFVILAAGWSLAAWLTRRRSGEARALRTAAA